MSDLNYKELQEKGVFDVPYKAFQFMQRQQAKINDSEAALKEALAWVEDLKRERGFLQKKCAERADRIDAVKAIMNDYYTGSYDESAEMAGLISAALDGEHE